MDVGGDGEDLFLLLHGLGATARVWAPLVDTAPWKARWLAPDLPGHGGSPPGSTYDISEYVEALLPLLMRGALPAGSVTLVGHSLGGVIALALAGRHDIPTFRAAFGLGIKLDWSASEIARMEALAGREPKLFDSFEEAQRHHAGLSGLGHIADESPLLERGVKAEGDKWRASADMRAFAVAPPDLESLIAAARCPVHLGAGENDPMVSIGRLTNLDPGAVVLREAGHSAMVDQPDAVARWISKCLDS